MEMLLESVRQGTIYNKNLVHLFFLGPNELSICNVDAVTPLMGPNGLEKGPSKFTYFNFSAFSLILIRYI
jgi:hypothetical protein